MTGREKEGERGVRRERRRERGGMRRERRRERGHDRSQKREKRGERGEKKRDGKIRICLGVTEKVSVSMVIFR